MIRKPTYGERMVAFPLRSEKDKDTQCKRQLGITLEVLPNALKQEKRNNI